MDREVGLVHLRPEVPAFNAGFDGEEDNVGFGECGVDFFDEALVVGDDGVDGFSFVDVVITGVEEDRFGLVGENDAVGEVDGVGELGAAEATVDGGDFREGFFEVPESDAGGSDEEVGVLGGRGFFVSGFKFGDIFFPLGEVGVEREGEKEGDEEE